MKAAPKSQRAMYDEASRKLAEINKTFLEMLPTMRRRDLERLIEKRPALWGRFARYLTSGHVFVDDPPATTRQHATKKKSPAQLDREIAEALAKAPESFTAGDVVQLRWEPGTGGIVRRVESGGWASISTPRGERSVPTDALVHVRKAHESRVRSSVERAARPRSHAQRKRAKVRIVNVEAKTPSGYRWLKINARGATVTPEGLFAVTDEHEWAQSLAAAGAREIK